MKKSNTSYHHGDLHDALLAAAIDMVRKTGVESVGLREVARQVGVTAAATYRHFASLDALLGELKSYSLHLLYQTMQTKLDDLTKSDNQSEVDQAIEQLHIIGYAYIQFALSEPGLFRAAFAQHVSVPEKATFEDHKDYEAYALLSRSVDELVRVGYLPPARRPFAEISLWATVHGTAMLLLDGPLAHIPDTERGAIINATLHAAMRGL